MFVEIAFPNDVSMIQEQLLVYLEYFGRLPKKEIFVSEICHNLFVGLRFLLLITSVQVMCVRFRAITTAS